MTERNTSPTKWLVIIGLIVLVDAYALTYLLTRPDHLLHVYFLDVGQGDATLIRTPDDKRILIDGGPNDEVEDLLYRALPWWDRRIDIMVLTHPHADHVTGLTHVLDSFKVGEFWYNGAPYATEIYTQLIEEVQAKDIPIKNPAVGYSADLGEVELRVIHPFAQQILTSDPNDTSIVNYLVYKNFDLLLTGDAGEEIETELKNRNLLYDIDVLKAGHHGSRTSSSQSFLDLAKPETAIIQVGENNYGHPHQEVVDRYRAMGTKLFQTRLDGTVEVVSDGNSYQVKTRRLRWFGI